MSSYDRAWMLRTSMRETVQKNPTTTDFRTAVRMVISANSGMDRLHRIKKRPVLECLLLWLFCMASVSVAQQQEDPAEAVEDSSIAVEDSTPSENEWNYVAADTSSPRATLKSFIVACNELHKIIQEEKYLDRDAGKYKPIAYRILDCIDTSELPAFALEERSAEVAVCLKEIIDREELPAWYEIPDSEEIERAGGYEKLPRWRIPGTRITIARVEEGPKKHEYLFSVGTVERASDYYWGVKARPYRTSGPETSPGFYNWYISAPGNPHVSNIVRRLPSSMQFGRTLGLANWKWPGLILLVVTGVFLMILLYRIRSRVLSRPTPRGFFATAVIVVAPLVCALLPFVIEETAETYLSIRGNPLYIIGFVTITIATLTGMFFVFTTSLLVGEIIISSPQINSKGLNAQLIRILFRFIGLALAVFLFLLGGQYMGIPIATLLASAGIGGIALALGAQDTLKTFFGTVMLMADKPFRVGDRIVFKSYDGVVEDIGMRSTRIRLLTSHQVTVPNDELARSDIENVGRRTCIRRVADIHLPLDTPHQKARRAVEILRNELQDHEGLDPEKPPRVFFLDFGENAFTIRVMYWYHPPDYWNYIAFSEKFNFAVFDAFEKEGIEFSLAHRVTANSVAAGTLPVDSDFGD